MIKYTASGCQCSNIVHIPVPLNRCHSFGFVVVGSFSQSNFISMFIKRIYERIFELASNISEYCIFALRSKALNYSRKKTVFQKFTVETVFNVPTTVSNSDEFLPFNLHHSRVDCCIQHAFPPCSCTYPDNNPDDRLPMLMLPSNRTLISNEKFANSEMNTLNRFETVAANKHLIRVTNY